MRCDRGRPVLAFLFLALPSATTLPATGAKAQQVLLEARIVEVTADAARQIGVAWRPLDAGHSELLFQAPGTVNGLPVDSVRIELGGTSLRALTARLVPDGWSFQARSGAVTLSGPPLAEDASLDAAFDLDVATRLIVAPRVQLGSRGGIALDVRPEIRALNRPQLIADAGAVLRLPQILAPGDVFQFRPLDPSFTPGGGTWTIANQRAAWNGSLVDPIYSLVVPEQAIAKGSPVDVRYVDPWGRKLVEAQATDVTVAPREAPLDSRPRVNGASPRVLSGSPVALCGNFPLGSASELLINGQPIGQYLVSAAPTILNLQLPPAAFPAGPFDLSAGASSEFAIADSARGVILEVTGTIDRNKLLRGESTSLALTIAGTTDPVELRLQNLTSDIVSLDGGEDQRVATSGGAPNRATRTVHAVRPGDFNLRFSLDVGANPCARNGEAGEEPPAQGYYDDESMNLGPEPEIPHYYGDPEECWGRLEQWLERSKGMSLADPAAGALLDEMNDALGHATASLADWRDHIHSLQHWSPEVGTPPDADHQDEIDRYQEVARCAEELRELVERPYLLPWNEYALLYVEQPRLPDQEAFRAPRPKTVEKEVPPPTPPPKTSDCPSIADYCDDLRRRAERLEADARAARVGAVIARENQTNDLGEAVGLDKTIAKNSAALADLRRQIEEYRRLTQSALDRAARADELARENPGGGWEEWARQARKDADGYARSGLQLSAAAKSLEQKIAGANKLAKTLRDAISDTERAARAAEEAAREARALFEKFCGSGLCPDSTPRRTERPPSGPERDTTDEQVVPLGGSGEMVIPPSELERWQAIFRGWWEWGVEIECRDAAARKRIEELGKQIRELEERIADLWQRIEQLSLTQSLLDPSEEIARQLDAYFELGRMLDRLEYLYLALAMLPRCDDEPPNPSTPQEPETPTPHTPSSQPEGPAIGGGPPELPAVPEEPLARCGPDISAAFDGALARVTDRIARLPANERNTRFLRENWPWRWPGDAQGPDDWVWDDLLAWDTLETRLSGCSGPRWPCFSAVWLWGRCRPAQVVLELFDQYVGALVTLPEPGESEGGTCRHAGCALAGEVDRVFGQREDGRISPEQLRDLAEDALAKISIPEKSWVRECDECAFCPHTIPEFSRDWTREDWILRNGDRLRPDGTVVPATKFSKPLG